jgi:hypothetical protein
MLLFAHLWPRLKPVGHLEPEPVQEFLDIGKIAIVRVAVIVAVLEAKRHLFPDRDAVFSDENV